MNYLQFKQAAKKHYFTCKCLYEKCNNSWYIQENIFYLCGYVVEMMLKYQIFRRIGYKPHEDIKKVNFNEITSEIITGKKGHNIIKLSHLLQKYDGSLIIDEIINKFGNWNVNIRYNGKKKSYENLKYLLSLCKKVIEEFEG